MTALAGIMRIELGRQTRRRRLLFFALLAAAPVVVAAVWVSARGVASAHELLGALFIVTYLHFLIPFTALFFGSGLISEEVGAQTLTYLLVRPVSRLGILAGKFLAFLVMMLLFVMVSLGLAVLVLWLGGGGTIESVGLVAGCVLTAAVAVIAYGSFFTMLGVLVAHPVVPGLALLIIWEGMVSNISGLMSRFTLVFYLRSLFMDVTDVTVSALGSLSPCGVVRAVLTPLAVAAVTMLVAWWRLSRRQFTPPA